MFGMGKTAPSEEPKGKKSKPEKKPALVTVTLKLEPKQRDKLELLGGEAWLREQIDAAIPVSPFAG